MFDVWGEMIWARYERIRKDRSRCDRTGLAESFSVDWRACGGGGSKAGDRKDLDSFLEKDLCLSDTRSSRLWLGSCAEIERILLGRLSV